MKTLICSAAMLLAGCQQWTGVQRDLVTQADRGVSMVGSSIDQQHTLLLAEQDGRRRRLDKAFIADVRQQVLIDQDWIVEAGLAYGAAIDAMHESRRSLDAGHAADVANLSATRAALGRLDWLLSLQTQGIPNER